MILLPKEIEEGNIEYKRDLLNINEERKNHLASQMKWRINEGNGIAIYYIGINDNGEFYGLNLKNLNLSIKIIKEITIIINCKINNIKKIEINNKYYCKLEIINLDTKNEIIYRVLFLGNSNSGKSTTINSLISKKKDNGRGSGRINLFNYKHEFFSGRTSSISIRHLGIKNNKIINDKIFSELELFKSSNKIFNLIDFPGHLKYIKNIFTKLSCLYGNLIFIIINPFNVNYKLIKLYTLFCKYNKLNFLVIFTNFDKEGFEIKIINIINFFKNNKLKILEYNNNIKHDYKNNFFIKISNLTFKNINLIENYLINYNFKKEINKIQGDLIQTINKYYNNEIGTIYSGLCLSGRIKENDILYTDNNGKWLNIGKVKFIINNNESKFVNKNDFIGIKIYNKIKKPSILVSNINNYNFKKYLILNILYFTNKKFKFKLNMNLSLFVNNNIINSKIIEIKNNKYHLELSKSIIILNNVILFKFNYNYGLSIII